MLRKPCAVGQSDGHATEPACLIELVGAGVVDRKPLHKLYLGKLLIWILAGCTTCSLRVLRTAPHCCLVFLAFAVSPGT